MRRTLAALALAMALPNTALLALPARAQGVVVVREGDTLSDIADRHGVSLARLMQANGISDPDLVVIGQRLTIPGGSGRSAAAAAPSSQPTAPYTVKSGETLSEIAARFNTSTTRLIQLNGIQNPDLVTSGTRLRIPMTPRSSAAAPAAAASRPAPNRNAREHVVQGGESLSVIAERYGTSVSQLVALNRIEDPDRLLAGTRLQLRGTPPAASSKPAAQAQPAPQAQPTPKPQPAAQTTPQLQAETEPEVSAASPPAEATSAAATTAAPAAASAAATAGAPASMAATTAARSTAATTGAAAATTTVATTAAAAAAPSAAAGRRPSPRPTAQPSVLQQASAPSTTARPATATTTAARPAAASTGANSGGASSGDWRSYGPLQIDWSKWQAMGGSHVAPSLSSDGKARYLAVNCTARKLNRTSSSGEWNSWESPQQDFETKLVQDICREKGD